MCIAEWLGMHMPSCCPMGERQGFSSGTSRRKSVRESGHDRHPPTPHWGHRLWQGAERVSVTEWDGRSFKVYLEIHKNTTLSGLSGSMDS